MFNGWFDGIFTGAAPPQKPRKSLSPAEEQVTAESLLNRLASLVQSQVPCAGPEKAGLSASHATPTPGDYVSIIPEWLEVVSPCWKKEVFDRRVSAVHGAPAFIELTKQLREQGDDLILMGYVIRVIPPLKETPESLVVPFNDLSRCTRLLLAHPEPLPGASPPWQVRVALVDQRLYRHRPQWTDPAWPAANLPSHFVLRLFAEAVPLAEPPMAGTLARLRPGLYLDSDNPSKKQSVMVLGSILAAKDLPQKCMDHRTRLSLVFSKAEVVVSIQQISNLRHHPRHHYSELPSGNVTLREEYDIDHWLVELPLLVPANDADCIASD